MQVVILAGGMATRLGELTRNQPKSMLIIHGRPFLEYQIELLKSQGIKDIVMCVGYLKDQIMGYFGDGSNLGVNIRYSPEHLPLGTAGALRNAEFLLDQVFYAMYGDSYLFLDFGDIMSYFLNHNKLALMTAYRNEDQYDRSNTAIAGDLVTKYDKQNRTTDMVYIDYGASIFRKETLEMIPKDQFYPLEELFPRLITRGELLSFEVRNRFYEIGSPEGLKEFTEFIAA